MENSKNKIYSVHVHFHGAPTPEFIEAFNKMLEVAADVADSEIKNGNLVNEAPQKIYCRKCGSYMPLWEKQMGDPVCCDCR